MTFNNEVSDEGKIKVKCENCGWEGTLKECGFGHDDFYCPECKKEAIEEVVEICHQQFKS